MWKQKQNIIHSFLLIILSSYHWNFSCVKRGVLFEIIRILKKIRDYYIAFYRKKVYGLFVSCFIIYDMIEILSNQLWLYFVIIGGHISWMACTHTNYNRAQPAEMKQELSETICSGLVAVLRWFVPAVTVFQRLCQDKINDLKYFSSIAAKSLPIESVALKSRWVA